jgi:hypothetical protein
VVAGTGEIDRFRPRWQVRSPSGQELTVEYDRLRDHWRVTPGEYVRRQLQDALAQATGSRPSADWITTLQDRIGEEQRRTA